MNAFARLRLAMSPGIDSWYADRRTPRWLQARLGDRLCLNGIEPIDVYPTAEALRERAGEPVRLTGRQFVRLDAYAPGYRGTLPTFDQAFAHVTVEESGTSGFIHAQHLKPIIPDDTKLYCDGDRRMLTASRTFDLYPDASAADRSYAEVAPTIVRVAVPVTFRVASHVAGTRVMLYRIELLDGERAGTAAYASAVTDSCILAKPPHLRIFLRTPATKYSV